MELEELAGVAVIWTHGGHSPLFVAVAILQALLGPPRTRGADNCKAASRCLVSVLRRAAGIPVQP